MDLFIDKYQRKRVKLVGGLQTAESADGMEELKQKVAALGIACQAMFEILQSNLNVSEAMIFEKMEEIDLRDGKLDGKASAAIIVCPQCGRNTNSSRSNCVYCGATLPVDVETSG